MTRTPDSAQASTPAQPEGFDDLVAALVHHDAAGPPADAPIDLPAWEQEASSAKRNLQGCRCALAIGELTSLLRALPTVGASLDGDDAADPWTLCAHAYHTAAGVLPKLGHEGLAHIAADRSMAFHASAALGVRFAAATGRDCGRPRGGSFRRTRTS
jgi:hypothetical protein